MKKKLSAALLCMVMALGLTACGGGSDSDKSGEQKKDTESPAELEEVTVVLPRPAECLDDVDFIVADEAGYFEENGLKVSFEVASGTSDMTMVSMGQGLVCFPDPDVMLLGRESDLDVIAFYQRDTIASNCLIVTEDSKIQKLQDIEGCSIAVGDASWSAGIDPVLAAAGVDLSKVEYVVAGEDRAQMVESGKVDAAFSWEKGYQLWQAQGMAIRAIGFADYVNVPGNPLVTTKDNVKNKADTLQKFCRAMAQAEYFTTCNPEAATKIVMERFPSIDVDFETGVEVINAAIKLWSSSGDFEEHGYGYVGSEIWENCVEYAKKADIIKGDIEAADCYTDQFVKYANDFDHEQVKADAEGYK